MDLIQFNSPIYKRWERRNWDLLVPGRRGSSCLKLWNQIASLPCCRFSALVYVFLWRCTELRIVRLQCNVYINIELKTNEHLKKCVCYRLIARHLRTHLEKSNVINDIYAWTVKGGTEIRDRLKNMMNIQRKYLKIPTSHIVYEVSDSGINHKSWYMNAHENWMSFIFMCILHTDVTY